MENYSFQKPVIFGKSIMFIVRYFKESLHLLKKKKKNFFGEALTL